MTQPTFSMICPWDALKSTMKAYKIDMSPTTLKYEEKYKNSPRP